MRKPTIEYEAERVGKHTQGKKVYKGKQRKLQQTKGKAHATK